MLTVRGAKRDTTSRFKLDRRLDILDDGKIVGQLACDLGSTQAEFIIDDQSYTMAATEAGPDEALAALLRQHIEGRAKPADKAFGLKDTTGHTLALAKQVKSSFVVVHAGNAFVLRKASFFSPPYRLYRTDTDQPLGSVGQKSLFNRTLHMDLPAELAAAFQAYLLMLALQLATQRAANNVSNYN
jgi:hypothetical protein